MKFARLAAIAAATVVASSGALANNVVENVAVTGNTATFSALHTDNLDFTDVFTFALEGTFKADVSAITIRLTPQQDIDFLSATLNGNSVTTFSVVGDYLEGFFSAPATYTGPLVLTVKGTSGAANGVFASYAGTLNVMPVPEPSTYAMLLAGLGAMGFIARRRRA